MKNNNTHNTNSNCNSNIKDNNLSLLLNITQQTIVENNKNYSINNDYNNIENNDKENNFNLTNSFQNPTNTLKSNNTSKVKVGSLHNTNKNNSKVKTKNPTNQSMISMISGISYISAISETVYNKNSLTNWPLLFQTIIKGTPKDTYKALKKKSNPNQKIEDGETALTLAASLNKTDHIIVLLQFGANPNLQKNDGTTALHISVVNKNNEITKILLLNGADPNIQTRYFNKTPLHVCIESNSTTEIFYTLCHFSCDFNIKDCYDKKAKEYLIRDVKNDLFIAYNKLKMNLSEFCRNSGVGFEISNCKFDASKNSIYDGKVDDDGGYFRKSTDDKDCKGFIEFNSDGNYNVNTVNTINTINTNTSNINNINNISNNNLINGTALNINGFGNTLISNISKNSTNTIISNSRNKTNNNENDNDNHTKITQFKKLSPRNIKTITKTTNNTKNNKTTLIIKPSNNNKFICDTSIIENNNNLNTLNNISNINILLNNTYESNLYNPIEESENYTYINNNTTNNNINNNNNNITGLAGINYLNSINNTFENYNQDFSELNYLNELNNREVSVRQILEEENYNEYDNYNNNFINNYNNDSKMLVNIPATSLYNFSVNNNTCVSALKENFETKIKDNDSPYSALDSNLDSNLTRKNNEHSKKSKINENIYSNSISNSDKSNSNNCLVAGNNSNFNLNFNICSMKYSNNSGSIVSTNNAIVNNNNNENINASNSNIMSYSLTNNSHNIITMKNINRGDSKINIKYSYNVDNDEQMDISDSIINDDLRYSISNNNSCNNYSKMSGLKLTNDKIKNYSNVVNSINSTEQIFDGSLLISRSNDESRIITNRLSTISNAMSNKKTKINNNCIINNPTKLKNISKSNTKHNKSIISNIIINNNNSNINSNSNTIIQNKLSKDITNKIDINNSNNNYTKKRSKSDLPYDLNSLIPSISNAYHNKQSSSGSVINVNYIRNYYLNKNSAFNNKISYHRQKKSVTDYNSGDVVSMLMGNQQENSNREKFANNIDQISTIMLNSNDDLNKEFYCNNVHKKIASYSNFEELTKNQNRDKTVSNLNSLYDKINIGGKKKKENSSKNNSNGIGAIIKDCNGSFGCNSNNSNGNINASNIFNLMNININDVQSNNNFNANGLGDKCGGSNITTYQLKQVSNNSNNSSNSNNTSKRLSRQSSNRRSNSFSAVNTTSFFPNIRQINSQGNLLELSGNNNNSNSNVLNNSYNSNNIKIIDEIFHHNNNNNNNVFCSFGYVGSFNNANSNCNSNTGNSSKEKIHNIKTITKSSNYSNNSNINNINGNNNKHKKLKSTIISKKKLSLNFLNNNNNSNGNKVAFNTNIKVNNTSSISNSIKTKSLSNNFNSTRHTSINRYDSINECEDNTNINNANANNDINHDNISNNEFDTSNNTEITHFGNNTQNENDNNEVEADDIEEKKKRVYRRISELDNPNYESSHNSNYKSNNNTNNSHINNFNDEFSLFNKSNIIYNKNNNNNNNKVLFNNNNNLAEEAEPSFPNQSINNKNSTKTKLRYSKSSKNGNTSSDDKSSLKYNSNSDKNNKKDSNSNSKYTSPYNNNYNNMKAQSEDADSIYLNQTQHPDNLPSQRAFDTVGDLIGPESCRNKNNNNNLNSHLDNIKIQEYNNNNNLTNISNINNNTDTLSNYYNSNYNNSNTNTNKKININNNFNANTNTPNITNISNFGNPNLNISEIPIMKRSSEQVFQLNKSINFDETSQLNCNESFNNTITNNEMLKFYYDQQKENDKKWLEDFNKGRSQLQFLDNCDNDTITTININTNEDYIYEEKNVDYINDNDNESNNNCDSNNDIKLKDVILSRSNYGIMNKRYNMMNEEDNNKENHNKHSDSKENSNFYYKQINNYFTKNSTINNTKNSNFNPNNSNNNNYIYSQYNPNNPNNLSSNIYKNTQNKHKLHNDKNRKCMELANWLTEINLQQYYDTLTNNNLFDLEKLQQLTQEKFFNDITVLQAVTGISKIGHAYRFLTRLKIDCNELSNTQHIVDYILTINNNPNNINKSILNNSLKNSMFYSKLNYSKELSCCGFSNFIGSLFSDNDNNNNAVKISNNNSHKRTQSFLDKERLKHYSCLEKWLKKGGMDYRLEANFSENGFDYLEYILVMLFTDINIDKEFIKLGLHVYHDDDVNKLLNFFNLEREALKKEADIKFGLFCNTISENNNERSVVEDYRKKNSRKLYSIIEEDSVHEGCNACLIF